MDPKGKKEGRREPRKTTLMAGVIVHDAATTDCTILDLSSSGARIRTSAGGALPARFFLINVRDRTAHDASLMWRKEHVAGLRFEKSYVLSGTLPASLHHLRQIWFDRATR